MTNPTRPSGPQTAQDSRRARRLAEATRRLRSRVDALRFAAPVTHVYDPLDYARRSYATYLRRYGASRKQIVFLGMNPGPYGMAQTGVPFGEVELVKRWLGIEERVSKPVREHPRRPVQGFACERSEVSGHRLWSAIASRFGSPERFFRRHFVANYCPLVFMEKSGRNRTPDKLPVRERAELFAACDDHLRSLVDTLEPEWVIGIGAFARIRAEESLRGRSVRVAAILHPSPANPRANRNWEATASLQLRALGVCTSEPGRQRGDRHERSGC